jgi:hypothetical protein
MADSTAINTRSSTAKTAPYLWRRCLPDGRYALFTRSLTDGNEDSVLGLVRMSDAPTIGGESNASQTASNTKDGPVLSLGPGWGAALQWPLASEARSEGGTPRGGGSDTAGRVLAPVRLMRSMRRSPRWATSKSPHRWWRSRSRSGQRPLQLRVRPEISGSWRTGNPPGGEILVGQYNRLSPATVCRTMFRER